MWRPVPKSADYDALKNRTERGVLAHIFDLLTVASSAAVGSEPITAPAMLPLTVLYSSDGAPQATYQQSANISGIRQGVKNAEASSTNYPNFKLK
jgi:hypothetical protein